jgi:hypothetical protein
MIPALTITIGYVRPIKLFHNINITLWFKSATSPATSKITWKYAVSQKQWPSWGIFLWKFIFDMKSTYLKVSNSKIVFGRNFIFAKNLS